MIRLGSMRHPSAALLLRRLSIGNHHARRRATMDNRPVDQSAPRNADSAYRDRPNVLATPSTTSQRADQRTSATSRQRPNPHSV
jgi:hypothetical protein